MLLSIGVSARDELLLRSQLLCKAVVKAGVIDLALYLPAHYHKSPIDLALPAGTARCQCAKITQVNGDG